MATAERFQRICVWPSTVDARTVASEQGCDYVAQMTVWPSEAEAAAHTTFEEGGGGEAYVAQAVHFDGTAWLANASLTCTENAFFSMAGWFKHPTIDPGPFRLIWIVDPEDAYLGSMGVKVDGNFVVSPMAASPAISADFASDSEPAVDVWHSVIVSVDTNHDTGEKIGKVYVDRVDVTDITDAVAAYLPAFNGLPFFLGSDTFGPDFSYLGDMADLRIMPGISLLVDGDIPGTTIDLFATAGNKPVDPATATATLGAPRILFSGDASTFATNQGSGGAFTLTGSLTNASTSPSD